MRVLDIDKGTTWGELLLALVRLDIDADYRLEDSVSVDVVDTKVTVISKSDRIEELESALYEIWEIADKAGEME